MAVAFWNLEVRIYARAYPLEGDDARLKSDDAPYVGKMKYLLKDNWLKDNRRNRNPPRNNQPRDNQPRDSQPRDSRR
jgi:hypothetical protein